MKSDSILPNEYVCQAIFDVSSGGIKELERNGDGLSRTDLDSHANMVVVGKHVAIVNDTGRRAEVSPFTPDYEALSKVPIVDAAIRYDCPYSGETYLLIVRNALSVPAMDHNLIPPFIMREAGVDVQCFPKIQCKNPDE